MRQRHPSFCLVALGCLVSGTAGQSPTPVRLVPWEPPPLRVSVTQLEETRPTETTLGLTTLTFWVAAEGLPANTTIRGIMITKAEDNLGHKVPTTSEIFGRSISTITILSSPGVTIRRASPPSRASGTVEFRPNIGTIDRDAESLKFVEGLIEFQWQPGPENTVINVEKVATRSGSIEAPRLALFGINVRLYSDQASYDRLAKELDLPPGPNPNFPRALGLYVRDPQLRFDTWYLEDDSGRLEPAVMLSRGTFAKGNLVELGFDDPLPPGARLVLRLKSDPIVQMVPFPRRGHQAAVKRTDPIPSIFKPRMDANARK